MAGNAVIGALRVVLGADTAALEKGLKGAQGKTSDFGKKVAIGAAAVATAVAAMGAAIGLGVKRSVDEADKLGKLAQSIGIPVDELSKLKHAADLSGVGIEGLSKSAGILAKNMATVVQTGTGPAAFAFQSLGIQVKNADGTLKSTSAIMTEVSGKFVGMADGSTKTALAMALFGKSGKDMIPMLNSGKEGLADMMKEAEQLGLVFDNKTSKAAENFNDNLTRLGRVKDGIINQLTARMLPALEALTNWLVKSAKESDLVRTVSAALARVFEGLARGVIFAYDNLGTLVRVLAVFIAAQVASVVVAAGIAFVKFAAAIRLAALATVAFNIAKAVSTKGLIVIAGIAALATGNFDALAGKLGELAEKAKTFLPAEMVAGTAAMLAKLGLNINALTGEFGKLILPADTSAKTINNLNTALANQKGQQAIESFTAGVAKRIAALQAELLTMGLHAGAQERAKVILEGLAVAQSKGITLTNEQREKLAQVGVEAEQAALRLRGLQIVIENQDPHTKLQTELRNNTAALKALGVAAEEVDKINARVAERMGLTWQQQASSVLGAWKDLGEGLGKENKKIAIAAKALAIGEALINAYLGASKALATGTPPWSWALAAASLAKGLAFVGSIKGISFATGGSFKVPGGMGGRDRVPVAMNLQPGEQVDIWRPGEGGPDPRAGAGGNRTIVVEGLDAAKFYSGKAMRKLIEAINEEAGNGARLRIA